MFQMETRTMKTLIAAVFGMSLVACGGGEETAKGQPEGPARRSEGQPAESGIPESVWAPQPVEGAVEIRDLVGKVQDGEEIRVAGRVKDFVESRAVFTMVDNELLACSDRENDSCPEPWDYCCEDATELARKTVTVELHDAAGKPLRHAMKGAHGLTHLDRITVSGQAHVNEAGNIRIVLAKLHRPD